MENPCMSTIYPPYTQAVSLSAVLCVLHPASPGPRLSGLLATSVYITVTVVLVTMGGAEREREVSKVVSCRGGLGPQASDTGYFIVTTPGTQVLISPRAPS